MGLGLISSIQLLSQIPFARTLNPQFCTFQSTTTSPYKFKIKSKSKSNISDAELASDLAKVNINIVLKEEAMKKSKHVLFTELCNYLNAKEEDVKSNWKKFGEEEKSILVKEFVNDWGYDFRPLSARFVKEMVDEYLDGEEESRSSGSFAFPGWKRILGF